jgi:Big-like domain-containing protein/Calx-beta domain-containing protein
MARLFALFLLAETFTRAQVAGPNGHFYKVVIEPNLLWEDARLRAAESTFNGVHGYLATIRSPEEDAFIESLRQAASPGGYGSLWVGGSQLPGATLPTESWFWVNGEGSIPTRDGGSGYSNWQPTEPNDYWGPQSEGFLSVGHFNNFGWNDEPNDRHIHGYVVEYPGGGISATVRIAATDPSAIEDALNQSPTDIAVFEFSRSGDLSLDLPVFYSIHGSAINGSDYNEISRSILIPAGQSSVRLNIVPRVDALTVVEPMETVGIRLEPSLILTPSAAYVIDQDHREAAAVIYENRPPQNPAIDIAVPANNFNYNSDENVTILAALYSPQPTERTTGVDFYAGDLKIGSSAQIAETGLMFFKFTWNDPPAGTHLLTARASASGAQVTSRAVRITVQQSPETPVVGIRFVAPTTTEPWPDTDFAPGYLEVTRSGSTAQNLQVFYSVTGTATADVDYEALQGYVVIGAGRTTAKIMVIAKDDLIDEPNETVALALVGADPANPTDPPTYVIDPEYRDATIVILDNDDPRQPTLRIAAVSGFTSEPIPNALVAPGLFRVSRTGSTTAPLQVYLRFSGTATPVADYPKLPGTVTIPAGASEIDLRVEPFSDDLVEGDETVIAAFEPIPAPYLIDPDHQRATVVIRDYEPGTHPGITITAPQPREYFNSGTDMRIEATAIDPDGYIPIVEFFANETKIGESALVFVQPPPPGTPLYHTFVWHEVPAGNYQLTVRGKDADNRLIVSDPVPVHAQDGPAMPFVSITAAPSEISEQSPLAFVFPSKVTVSRVYGLEYPVRVYLKYEGTATRELDYEPAPTEVVIPAGSSSVEFLLNAKMDNLVEGPETVMIRIAPPLLPLNPDPANHVYEINPDHRAAKITINDMTSPGLPTVSLWKINESTREPRPNEDVAPAVFALRRTGSTENPIAVYLSYAGTATINADYPNPGTVVEFRPGQAEVRVEIYATDESLVEGDETVIVSLGDLPPSVPPQYRIDPEHRSVTLIIHDNESPQPNLVHIESTDPVATEFPPNVDGFDPARFYLSRAIGGDWTRPLQVFLSLHGTAKNGEDYETLPTSFTIPAGLGFVWIDLIPREDNHGVFNKYEIVSAPGISWATARRQAEESIFNGVHGHLATLTSAQEDAHVESLRLEVGSGGAYWVGGYQEQGEPSITENWKWVNNEGPIPGINGGPGYANWLANEPNDYWGPSSENHMVIGWLNTFGWNDQGENIGAQGYVVEYPVVIGVPAEIMESVALRIEPSPLVGPMAGYEIDHHNRTAIAVIFEHQAPAGGAIEVAFPSPNFTYSSIGDVDFFVAGYHPSVDIVQVDFYVDGAKIGFSNTSGDDEDPAGGFERHRFQWAQATPGRHTLHALATVNGQTLSTMQIPFVVENDGANQSPTARITEPHDGASFIEGQPVTFVVEASDSDGTISRIDLITTDQGNQVIATANGPTLRFTVNNLPIGTHTFFARAFDNLEAMGIAPAVHILVRHRDAVAFVHRDLPGSYSPGVAFTVELRANPPAGTHAYAIEDRPPNGWQVASVSHEGAFDSITGKVKFGPFTDATPRTLTYRLTPPANAAGHHDFAGNSSLNGAAYPIAGDDGIDLVQQFHPADQNQDFSILLGETTAYAAAWKAGDSWAAGPVPIPVNYVTSAATIWKRGEAYHFDSTRGAAPACWVPVAGSGPPFQPFDDQPTTNATRSISGEFRAGAAARVQITTVPASGTTSYAIEENPPRGWTVTNISHDGTFDAGTGAIRWGVFMDGMPRTLTYSVTPPAGVASVGTFGGQFSFDGRQDQISFLNSVTTDGATPIQITNCRRTSAGMHLQVLGPAGQTAVIEASADFVTWTELESIFIPNGAIEFTDESTSATGHRFYRLRVQ